MTDSKQQSEMSKSEEDNNRQSMLFDFVEITGTELPNGRFYMESANWNLEMALANYYEDLAFGGEGAGSKKKEETAHEMPIETIELDSDPEDDPNTCKPMDESSISVVSSVPPSADSTKSKVRPRFATMSSIRAHESSSDEEEGQTYYAGGSENSGQQVVGPPARQPNELITDLFRSLREHGGIESSSSQETSNLSFFSGQGYRLGQSVDDTQVTPASGHASARRPREVVLRLWRNGFSLDDGPLRLYSNPIEREFLSRIRQGSVPAELLPNIDGDSVSMSLEDHRHEYFRATKETKSATPFTGQGHVLGSTMSTNNIHPEQAEPNEPSENFPVVEINANEPTTNIQIRLPDGNRLRVTLNQQHTIGHLRSAIIAERPELSGRPFRLMTTFPSNELTDDRVTLLEADLLNSCLLLQN